MATFQCEEGLVPSGPTTSTCTDTETGGQWLPNPADTQCTGSTTTGEEINRFQIPRLSSLVAKGDNKRGMPGNKAMYGEIMLAFIFFFRPC